MANLVFVYGKSGSGKSFALRNFAPDEIFYVNVAGKPLPFPGKFKYTLKTRDVNLIVGGLKKMPCKAAVVDDAGYLMTDMFMAGHSQPKKGATTFDLYNDIGDTFYRLVNVIITELPEDVVVYLMMHEISNDYGETKLRTIGKLLDEKVCLEGMATIVLHAFGNGSRWWLATQGNGMDIAKSPYGMFPGKEVDNDLKAVDSGIRLFYGLEEPNQPKEEKQHAQT